MKKWVLLFVLAFCFSCQDPDPDLSSAMVGKYYLTETTADSVLNVVWDITANDRKHVNLAIEIQTSYTDQGKPAKRELMVIEKIRVSRRRDTLDFSNDFDRKGEKFTIIGKASRSGAVMTCDAIVSDTKGQQEHWGEALTRKP